MINGRRLVYKGNLRKNVKFQFFGDRMEKKHFHYWCTNTEKGHCLIRKNTSYGL